MQLLTSLTNTLSPSTTTRQTAEAELLHLETQPHFTENLLDLLTSDIQDAIKVSAAILFKNRVAHYWDGESSRHIADNEKNGIKNKLIETLVHTYRVNAIRVQLSDALYSILDHDKWEELVEMIKQLLKSSDIAHVHVGLICLQKYTQQYRWVRFDKGSNPVLEEVATDIFPMLEQLASDVLSQKKRDDSDILVYMILKTFKYTTFSYMPEYLCDPVHLGTWCRLHFAVIDGTSPSANLKWAFANLARLVQRHGAAKTPFAEQFVASFVPEMLSEVWRVVERWAMFQLKLSGPALHHLLALLRHVVPTAQWPLVRERLGELMEHLVMPLLRATDESIELYDDEPEEYARKYFDTNSESSRADSAAVDFVFHVVSSRPEDTLALILEMAKNTVEVAIGNLKDRSQAAIAESGLRVLATVSHKLRSRYSPCQGQEDAFVSALVLPFLAPEAVEAYPWLAARACDTLAMSTVTFRAESTLDDVFSAVTRCVSLEGQFPIQMTAVQALATMVAEDAVCERIAPQVPQLMHFLLEMSRQYESDALTIVMETFVERFSATLEPFAAQLAASLAEQFEALAQEVQDVPTEDKENKGCGILNTLSTLVMAMAGSPGAMASVEPTISTVVRSVLDNAMAAFLPDALELAESVVYSSRSVPQTMWTVLDTCNEAFDTYACEYLGTFEPFYVAVVNYGFVDPRVSIDLAAVQKFFTTCFGLLRQDPLDPLVASSAFQMVELAILALGDRGRSAVPRFAEEILAIHARLEDENAFDGYMLHRLAVLKVLLAAVRVDPTVVASKQFSTLLFSLWLKHGDDFQSVYGCKLQILAALAVLGGDNLASLGDDLVPELVGLLMANVAALPSALRRREEMRQRDQAAFQIAAERAKGGDYEDIEWEEDDEAELEALEVTPIDDVNVFAVLVEVVGGLRERGLYGGLFGEGEKELVEQIEKISR